MVTALPCCGAWRLDHGTVEPHISQGRRWAAPDPQSRSREGGMARIDRSMSAWSTWKVPVHTTVYSDPTHSGTKPCVINQGCPD